MKTFPNVEDAKLFISTAFLHLFSEAVPSGPSPYGEANQVSTAAWDFAVKVRSIPEEHLDKMVCYIDPDFDNATLHATHLMFSYKVDDAENPGIKIVVLPSISKVHSEVVAAYVRARRMVALTENLDDVHQFMVGNVASLVKKGDGVDQHLYNHHKAKLNNALILLKEMNGLTGEEFRDFSYVSQGIVDRAREKCLKAVGKLYA